MVGSTLSGYTGPGAVPGEPDIAFVQRLAAASCRVLVDVSGRKLLSTSVPGSLERTETLDALVAHLHSLD